VPLLVFCSTVVLGSMDQLVVRFAVVQLKEILRCSRTNLNIYLFTFITTVVILIIYCYFYACCYLHSAIITFLLFVQRIIVLEIGELEQSGWTSCFPANISLLLLHLACRFITQRHSNYVNCNVYVVNSCDLNTIIFH
jgi:hypothetical protein